jgi:hypothetical protein
MGISVKGLAMREQTLLVVVAASWVGGWMDGWMVVDG